MKQTLTCGATGGRAIDGRPNGWKGPGIRTLADTAVSSVVFGVIVPPPIMDDDVVTVCFSAAPPLSRAATTVTLTFDTFVLFGEAVRNACVNMPLTLDPERVVGFLYYGPDLLEALPPSCPLQRLRAWGDFEGVVHCVLMILIEK